MAARSHDLSQVVFCTLCAARIPTDKHGVRFFEHVKALHQDTFKSTLDWIDVGVHLLSVSMGREELRPELQRFRAHSGRDHMLQLGKQMKGRKGERTLGGTVVSNPGSAPSDVTWATPGRRRK